MDTVSFESPSKKQCVQDEVLCVICGKGDLPLSSTENGREKIKDAAMLLDDITVLNRCTGDTFSYHCSKIKWCYKTYTRKSANYKAPQAEVQENDENLEDLQEQPPKTRSRSSSSSSVCVICNSDRAPYSVTESRERTVYRICEDDRAQMLLDAMNFNMDDVKTRCSLFVTLDHVFVADVMYHPACLRTYLRRYEKRLAALSAHVEECNNKMTVNKDSLKVFKTLDFKTTGYSLSYIRDQINESLDENAFQYNNDKVKILLVKHFGSAICFTYPHGEKKVKRSQMVYSNVFGNSWKVVEVLRQQQHNKVKYVATELLKECTEYQFELNESACSSSDVKLATIKYSENRPKLWMHFVSELFPSRDTTDSEQWLLKFDTVFQFFYYWLTTGAATPLQCALAQVVYKQSKSKELLNIFNRHGITISYQTMKRIDVTVANKIVSDTLPHRCPVSNQVNDVDVIQCAADNFNFRDNTIDGLCVTNDTVMVIFQNQLVSEAEIIADPNYKDQISVEQKSRAVKFDDVLPCQKLENSGLSRGTAEVDETLQVTPYSLDDAKKASSAQEAEEDYFTWSLGRKLLFDHENEEYEQTLPNLPSTQSFLQPPNRFKPTVTSFTPILPYPATDIDSIFTTMINFNDVLKQKNAATGVFWADQGVYHIAKEIHMLRPDLFGHLFIGLGPFHAEKIIISCLGDYLSPIGIDYAMVEAAVFGKGVVEGSVMNGGDYVKGKNGMALIAEVMNCLMFRKFVKEEKGVDPELEAEIEEVEQSITGALEELEKDDREGFLLSWELLKMRQKPLWSKFSTWKKDNGNQNIQYWALFVDEIYPVLRDYTHSVRVGDFDLYVSAHRRAMALFFVFGKTNYSRDGSLYLQDLLQLRRKFPGIYRHFKDGGFSMYHTSKTGSGVGIDMGLEKIHNKPAKGPGGVIGETRKKEAIAMWNLMRYEKEQYRSFLLDRIQISENDNELNLHHDFNPTTTAVGNQRFEALVSYIEMVGDPFESVELINIVTGVEIAEEVTLKLLDCIEFGDQQYNEFVDTRLDNKEKSIQDPVSRNTGYLLPTVVPKKKPAREMSRKGMGDIVRFMDYAVKRGSTHEELLKFELCENAYFLEKEGKRGKELKKSPKHELMNALVSRLPQVNRNVIETEARTMVVVDFMGLLRKIPAKTMNLKTYEELMNTTYGVVTSLVDKTTTRIDIVFDIYSPDSIKAYERTRRGSEKIDIQIRSVNQALPGDMEHFWNSSKNKTAIQLFFCNWMKENYSGSASVFYGGLESGKCLNVISKIESEVDELCCSTKEEADDRLIMHIVHGCESGIQSVLVYSPDSDVFVSLLHHFQESFTGLEHLYMKIGRTKRTKKTVPMHLLQDNLSDELISVLPAVHALSGCDTTSKIGAKTAILKKPVDLNLIRSFGKAELDEEMIKSAEKFLLQLMGHSEFNTCDELRVHQYYDSKKNLSLKTMVCCSKTVELHIKRAYIQANYWYNAGNRTSVPLNPLEYGYHIVEAGMVPRMVQQDTRPQDIRDPCTCAKCAMKTCPCRSDYVKCLQYCHCKPALCKNPYNDSDSD